MIDQTVSEANNDYEGEKNMKNKIQELFDEVELYKQAVQDAENALASAEQELDEILTEEYMKREEE